MLVIFTAGLAPGLALLSYFYLKDYYGTEPIFVVVRTFLFGAVLVFPIMFIQYVLGTEGLISNDAVSSFLATGFLEEFVKWFVLMYTIYSHVSFDEPYDGIVYGSAVSLGFASAENIFYLISNGVEFAFGRALLPVSSHALFGVIMGYYLGKGKFASNRERAFMCYALIIPVFLHGVYDYILLKESIWLYGIAPFMIFLWWFGLRKYKKARRLSDVYAVEMMR
ncbi:glutamic-type intramembrane protease PrsW [Bacillus testis]|uniref:glutamic-type intramembrane protease PrsW n=1 Tax=Bacillus testis TaxID=1622072 RepID=UPI00067F4B12|nr:glutamic-type intramembrane protease PrsW [Bacillus testis]